ncbi:MAG TPA: hypothetical protein VF992_00235 [Thermoplasmata archaeon]
MLQFEIDQAREVAGDAHAQDFAALRLGALAVDLVAQDCLEGVVAGLGVVAPVRPRRKALRVKAAFLPGAAVAAVLSVMEPGSLPAWQRGFW